MAVVVQRAQQLAELGMKERIDTSTQPLMHKPQNGFSTFENAFGRDEAMIIMWQNKSKIAKLGQQAADSSESMLQ